jgi:hypothetical protein
VIRCSTPRRCLLIKFCLGYYQLYCLCEPTAIDCLYRNKKLYIYMCCLSHQSSYAQFKRPAVGINQPRAIHFSPHISGYCSALLWSQPVAILFLIQRNESKLVFRKCIKVLCRTQAQVQAFAFVCASDDVTAIILFKQSISVKKISSGGLILLDGGSLNSLWLLRLRNYSLFQTLRTYLLFCHHNHFRRSQFDTTVTGVNYVLSL